MPIIDGEMQAFSLTLDKFLDHAAKWTPTAQVATAHEDGRIDRAGYADLHDRARRVSAVLEALGVRAGDRVATLAWNSQAHVEVWFAIMGMGAVCHTLNPRLTAEQLAAMVVQSEAGILIASADLAGLAREIKGFAPHLKRLLIIDGEAEGDEALAPMIEAEPRRAVWGGFEETAPCGLCFTSGTTGAPKGVTYTHRSSYLHTLRILQVDGMAISGADAVLAVVPMFHANAWGLPFAAPAVGAKLVLPGRNTDGASLARLIAAEGVTIAVGVPTVWSGLMDHLDATGQALPSLKRIIVGGAPMPPALMARLEQRLGVRVQTSWGMTELSPCGVLAPLSAPGDAAVAGRPAVGVDLLLTDADGVALPKQRDVEGHLRVRGASVVARYFGQQAPATDAQGWFATGDLARIDADGALMITGRSKDLIKSGGEWINPAEIEALICALPEVSQAAVIGRAHPKWGERPILLVEAPSEISDERLLDALRGRVASWWLPDAVYRLPRMPLAATGKIDKLRLRSEYGAG